MISYNRILRGIKYLFPCSPFSLFRSLWYTFKYAKNGQVASGRKVKIYVKKNGKCEFHGNTDIGLKPTRIGYTGHPSFDYTIIQNNGGTLISDDWLHLKSGCRIVVGEDAILKLGKNVLIEYDTMVLTREKIEIGDDTWISWRCNIMDTDFHRIIINKEEKLSTQPIRIGKNCWIASCVTILKGVTIGDNCIIGANSVVTGDIPPNSLAVGNPCKVVKTEVNWEK